MSPPRHDYIENTIRSMRAAFDAGAEVVEIDVQWTRDGRFAVFHDRNLECRTDGRGRVGDHTMAELKTLDVAYGYTSDGETYPFRGRGVGLIPDLDEVFERFPEGAFLLDLKSGDPADGRRLAARLAELPSPQRRRMTIYGREDALAGFRTELPEVPAFSVASTTECLVRYAAYGWTGIVPESCRNAPVYVPINVAPWLWGWPARFVDRMEASGSPVVILGEFGSGGVSPGIDTDADLARIPAGFDGGIWTNDVERVRRLTRGTVRRDSQEPGTRRPAGHEHLRAAIQVCATL
jgi:glycerophosphoryl diester phosphodiesterase